MSKSIKILSKDSLRGASIIALLFTLVNLTIINQYIDFSTNQISAEQCEEEEEIIDESDVDLFIKTFFSEIILPPIYFMNNKNISSAILLDYQTEVFTPPPELI